MRITEIESLRFEAYPRLLVVRVHSDTGLIGTGETVDKVPGAVGALHGTIAPLLLGWKTGTLQCPKARASASGCGRAS